MARPLEIVTVPCLSDNFVYILRDVATGTIGVIDAPDAAPIEAALDERGWGLDQILITHHHADHIDGVPRLVERFGPKVIGAKKDEGRLPKLDAALDEGDTWRFGDSEAVVIDVSGHTVNHIAYHFADAGVVFTGDSLFAIGCGRVFEGTHAMMWDSLSKLAALPPETEAYFGHEYTEANAKFAVTADPENEALAERVREVSEIRARGEWTTPTTIARELETNPFLRATESSVQKAVGMEGADPAAVFGEVRRRKDNF